MKQLVAPTIEELLLKSDDYLAENLSAVKTALKNANERIKQLESEVVFGFYEEEYPMYVQGYEKGLHELTSPVTACEVNAYVETIKLASKNPHEEP